MIEFSIAWLIAYNFNLTLYESHLVFALAIVMPLFASNIHSTIASINSNIKTIYENLERKGKI